MPTRNLQLEVGRDVDELLDRPFRLAGAARVVGCRRRVGGRIVKLFRPGEDPADGGEDVRPVQELVVRRPELDAPTCDGDLRRKAISVKF